jgi:hypothetical protein
MAKDALNDKDVYAGFEQMGRKGAPEIVRT